MNTDFPIGVYHNSLSEISGLNLPGRQEGVDQLW